MQKTPIEYLNMTWNPIPMLCTPVSAGCDNCWHRRMANRLSYNRVVSENCAMAYSGHDPIIKIKELSAPLRRKKPAVIGVEFMGDLFHESIPYEWIAAVYGVMAATPQHRYVILTKRARRMWEWSGIAKPSLFFPCAEKYGIDPSLLPHIVQWPPPNVIQGVSVEDQETADERLEWLASIPTKKRFVSYEPAIRPVDFFDHIERNNINWIIMGAETGPGARPMDLDWARSARDQCQEVGADFFFKQDSQGNRELDGRRHEEVPW